MNGKRNDADPGKNEKNLSRLSDPLLDVFSIMLSPVLRRIFYNPAVWIWGKMHPK